MLEYIAIGLVSDLVKIIHIELPYKGREITVPKVNRQNLLLEFLDIFDNKWNFVFIPVNDAFVLFILNGNFITSRISNVLAMKIEGCDPRSFLALTGTVFRGLYSLFLWS